jgi:K+:H+ antiporter
VSADSIVTHVTAAVALIVALSYAVGQICRRIRQPEVIGQLIAGIALGPSLLGRLGPGVMRALWRYSRWCWRSPSRGRPARVLSPRG